MVREHDKERRAEGESPPIYFLDIFVLNQHQMTNGCTSDEEMRNQLIQGLQNSLRTCGTMLLCCTAGPDGVGWERPAPFGRVWCLFEIFVSIAEDVKVAVRFAPKDSSEFRQALTQGGMRRVEAALRELDARDASATVENDKVMILGDIEATVGLSEFNLRVRESMRTEYRRIATNLGIR